MSLGWAAQSGLEKMQKLLKNQATQTVLYCELAALQPLRPAWPLFSDKIFTALPMRGLCCLKTIAVRHHHWCPWTDTSDVWVWFFMKLWDLVHYPTPGEHKRSAKTVAMENLDWQMPGSQGDSMHTQSCSPTWLHHAASGLSGVQLVSRVARSAASCGLVPHWFSSVPKWCSVDD